MEILKASELQELLGGKTARIFVGRQSEVESADAGRNRQDARLYVLPSKACTFHIEIKH